MAAIATAVDLSLGTPRVGITLSAWTDGTVTITRVHPNGDRVSVRDVPAASGGASFVYDYENLNGEPIYYEAYSGATLITSSALTVAYTDMLVSVPGMPQMVLQIDAEQVPDAEMDRPTADLTGPFRAVAPSEYGELQAEAFSVTVKAQSLAQRTAMEQILAQSGVLLLRMPLTEYAAMYVEVSHVSRKTFVPYRRMGISTTTEADWRRYDLTCRETSFPVGASFGDPTASYQALVDSGKTYQQMLDWKGVGATTYLDMLKGGF